MDSASFPEQSEGRWSIRVFKDGRYTVVSRVDFDILPRRDGGKTDIGIVVDQEYLLPVQYENRRDHTTTPMTTPYPQSVARANPLTATESLVTD